jgi:hypothetical protein
MRDSVGRARRAVAGWRRGDSIGVSVFDRKTCSDCGVGAIVGLGVGLGGGDNRTKVRRGSSPSTRRRGIGYVFGTSGRRSVFLRLTSGRIFDGGAEKRILTTRACEGNNALTYAFSSSASSSVYVWYTGVDNEKYQREHR